MTARDLRAETRSMIVLLCGELDAGPGRVAAGLIALIRLGRLEHDHPGGDEGAIAELRDTAAEMLAE